MIKALLQHGIVYPNRNAPRPFSVLLDPKLGPSRFRLKVNLRLVSKFTAQQKFPILDLEHEPTKLSSGELCVLVFQLGQLSILRHNRFLQSYRQLTLEASFQELHSLVTQMKHTNQLVFYVVLYNKCGDPPSVFALLISALWATILGFLLAERCHHSRPFALTAA